MKIIPKEIVSMMDYGIKQQNWLLFVIRRGGKILRVNCKTSVLGIIVFAFLFLTVPLHSQDDSNKKPSRVVYGKTVIDAFLDDIVERVALLKNENEDRIQSFVFNQHSSLNSTVITYFTIESSMDFEELYIRTRGNEIITILPSSINKTLAGDYRRVEHRFIVYPEQLDAIYQDNSDTKARIVHYDEIRGAITIDFTIPLEFWQKVRAVNLGESDSETEINN